MARTSAFVGKQVGKLDGMLGDSFSRIVPASNRKNLSNSSFVQGGREEVVERGNASPRNNRPRVHLYTRVESSASDDAGKDQVTGENSAARRNN